MYINRQSIYKGFTAFMVVTASFAQNVDFSFQNNHLPIDKRAEILVSQMTIEEKINQLKNGAAAIPRLKVPDYDWWNEALHGIGRNGKATIFPQAIALGATFDPQLAERVASAISTEARAKYAISQKNGNHSKYAGLTFWTPNINIFRDPRWGRGQETYGEDPLLTSRIGVAFVKGLQGNDPKYLKSAACAKHFAVHSGPENIRHEFNAEPNKQDLYETYLPAFEALVKEAKVEGVMAAYNAVYGKPACASDFLLKETLRDKWKFDGYVTSDCGAVSGVYNKLKYVKTAVEAAAVALNSGTNLECGTTYSQLKKAIDQGLITEKMIHDRTVQLFKTRFRLGMFDEKGTDNPYLNFGIEKIHSPEHIALSKEVALKSIVLLKNKNNILPLSKDIKIPYVTGPFANSNDMLMGSYYGVTSGMVTILEGVADVVSPSASLNYRSGVLPFHKNINPKNWAPFEAGESDVTICVVGLTADREGEEVDAIAAENVGDKVDLKLPQSQIDYVKEIASKIKGKPLVLVIASGSPVSLEGIEELCDAIVQIWYPGEQGGNAVADILFGNSSPSGHLPITFPKNVAQLPAYEDYSMKGRTYKYMTEEPMYPFGFGLTYSKTEFRNLKLSTSNLKEKQTLTVTVEVANTGNYDIDEVVQLYVNPMELSGGIPLKSLKAFERISLKKGEKKSINFKLTPNNLKVVNEQGQSVWRNGNYQLVVGNASPGALSTRLGAATPQTAILQLK
ncbi:glycoside hydrolase family 3 C-terminal domain-containing protein [Flavobacterium sp. NG2]|uniref:glycoside hydrolase family 3 C-terminal domain-containing protein n=1 Tax=Flavobacterium sp. NG2 TaxID=3097547 RepID=UPI002A82DF66|nr:glycoside hydrolase family 3 C-terminal domain-containing protein [Flavobacterium sp. NG2]WPR71106.1 glycoside hydrolase family 3 C-terminal domain-containing protein [Flavobacterium sp. NG2]